MKYVIPLLLALLLTVEPSLAGNDSVELPSWANTGDLESELSSKGKEAASIISIIVAILAIVGMLVGAGFFAVGNQENGKKYLIGGIIGLIIAGSVFGIAAIFIS